MWFGYIFLRNGDGGTGGDMAQNVLIAEMTCFKFMLGVKERYVLDACATSSHDCSLFHSITGAHPINAFAGAESGMRCTCCGASPPARE